MSRKRRLPREPSGHLQELFISGTCNTDEEDQKAELLVAVLQGEGDGLETGGVSGQLEDSHDSHNSENLSDKSSKSWLVLLLQKF